MKLLRESLFCVGIGFISSSRSFILYPLSLLFFALLTFNRIEIVAQE